MDIRESLRTFIEYCTENCKYKSTCMQIGDVYLDCFQEWVDKQETDE